jgi:hypothetical protein
MTSENLNRGALGFILTAFRSEVIDSGFIVVAGDFRDHLQRFTDSRWITGVMPA